MAKAPKRPAWMTDETLADADCVPLEIAKPLRPEYERALAEFDRRFAKKKGAGDAGAGG